MKEGFHATNDIFAKNALYFRNALVRANYTDLKNGIHETTEYLDLFLRNLLLDENNILSNREMHISEAFNKLQKLDIQTEELDIQNKIIESVIGDILDEILELVIDEKLPNERESMIKYIKKR